MKKTSQSTSKDLTTNKMDICAAYIRVSTKKQSKFGHSIATQLALAKQYAINKDWHLPEELIFIEEKSASSNKDIDYEALDNPNSSQNTAASRPIFLKMLENAAFHKFKHLIVYSIDRFNRQQVKGIKATNYLVAKGIQIHSTKEGENLINENPILSSFYLGLAELEAYILSTRVKDALKTCVKNGLYPGGTAPFGYSLDKTHSKLSKSQTKLKKNPSESFLVERVFDYYLSGLGYKRIADKMKVEAPKYHWYKSKVESIITNPKYQGSIFFDRNNKNPDNIVVSPIVKENIIITKDIWDKSKAIREERTQQKDPYDNNTPFILKHKVICEHCGREMKPYNPGKAKTNVYRCATSKKEREICNCIIPAVQLEGMVINKLPYKFQINHLNRFYEIYTKNYDYHSKMRKNYIDGLKTNLENNQKYIFAYEKYIDTIKPTKIKKAFTNQLIFKNEKAKKIEASLTFFKNIDFKKLTKDDFFKIFNYFIPLILDTSKLGDDFKNTEIRFIQRQFIKNFIYTVTVNWDKESKKIKKIDIETQVPNSI